MRLLVEIDLDAADLELSEAHEKAVLPFLAEFGARIEARVRSIDGRRELHLLYFPGAAAFNACFKDPRRLALQPDWDARGAVTTVTEVIAF